MVHHVVQKYEEIFKGDRQSVSIQFVKPQDSHSGFPTHAWYRHVIENLLDPDRMVFLIFAEDTSALSLFTELAASRPQLRFHLIEEDFATSLLLMSMCTHHVVTVSTFGFWGKSGNVAV